MRAANLEDHRRRPCVCRHPSGVPSIALEEEGQITFHGIVVQNAKRLFRACENGKLPPSPPYCIWLWPFEGYDRNAASRATVSIMALNWACSQ